MLFFCIINRDDDDDDKDDKDDEDIFRCCSRCCSRCCVKTFFLEEEEEEEVEEEWEEETRAADEGRAALFSMMVCLSLLYVRALFLWKVDKQTNNTFSIFPDITSHFTTREQNRHTHDLLDASRRSSNDYETFRHDDLDQYHHPFCLLFARREESTSSTSKKKQNNNNNNDDDDEDKEEKKRARNHSRR